MRTLTRLTLIATVVFLAVGPLSAATLVTTSGTHLSAPTDTGSSTVVRVAPSSAPFP